MSSKKLTPPATEEMSHAKAVRAAAEYCKDAGLAEYRFSSEEVTGVLLYNLGHSDYKKMRDTDPRIHCASGIPDIWVAANGSQKKRRVA